MAQERIFVEGMYGKAPHPNAPSFVLGKGSINVERFIEYLQSDEAKKYFNEYNGANYFNFDIYKSKDGDKISFIVNTYRKEEGDYKAPPSKSAKMVAKAKAAAEPAGDDDLPF